MNKTVQAKEGFTLIELVIAIFILGILIGIGVPLYYRYVGQARENTTRTNLRNLKQVIKLYQTEFGSYPKRLEDLVERPAGEAGKKWRPFFEKLPKDGWGRDFEYKRTPKAKQPYELYSYGPGGPEVEGEEIRVWDL